MIQSDLDAGANDPKIKEALTQAAVSAENELITPLLQFHNNGRPIGIGWTLPPNGARWGVDYVSRAATARSNKYDNAPQEARYIYTDFAGKEDAAKGEESELKIARLNPANEQSHDLQN